MPDTERSLPVLLAAFATNQAGAITAQDARDFIVSALGGYGAIYAKDGLLPQTVNIAAAKLAGFSLNGPSAGAIPDFSDSSITVGVTGVYWLEFAGDVSCAAGSYRLTLRVNGAESVLTTEAGLDASGLVHVGFAGPVALSAGDVVSVWAEGDSDGLSLALKQGQFALKRTG
jgi:hypothetical protein